MNRRTGRLGVLITSVFTVIALVLSGCGANNGGQKPVEAGTAIPAQKVEFNGATYCVRVLATANEYCPQTGVPQANWITVPAQPVDDEGGPGTDSVNEEASEFFATYALTWFTWPDYRAMYVPQDKQAEFDVQLQQLMSTYTDEIGEAEATIEPVFLLLLAAGGSKLIKWSALGNYGCASKKAKKANAMGQPGLNQVAAAMALPEAAPTPRRTTGTTGDKPAKPSSKASTAATNGSNRGKAGVKGAPPSYPRHKVGLQAKRSC